MDAEAYRWIQMTTDAPSDMIRMQNSNQAKRCSPFPVGAAILLPERRIPGRTLLLCVRHHRSTHGAFFNIDPGLTAAGIQTGLYKGFLLLPGPFTYPYYYSLFSYNDKNEDGTQHGNMKKSFVLAGVMFGVYMVLAALLTWVNFSPLLNTLKAILITIIALSSLSTYLYSEYLVFGENIGFLIDVLTVTSWQLVIPLGVMGIWTLMSELRVYIIIFVLLASVVLHLVSDRKEDAR